MKTFFFILLSCVGLSSIPAQNNDWKSVLQEYLTLEEALVRADVSASKTALTEMQQKIYALDEKNMSVAVQNEVELLKKQLLLSDASAKISGLRSKFKQISIHMITLAENNAFPEKTLYVLYCPMRDANWLDDTKEVYNPYYGKSMLRCGKVTATIN